MLRFNWPMPEIRPPTHDISTSSCRNDPLVQQAVIGGTSVDRHGTWKVDSDQLTLFDEYGSQDGPYTAEIDAVKKTTALSMPQGLSVHSDKSAAVPIPLQARSLS